jgi:hypothetical protein
MNFELMRNGAEENLSGKGVGKERGKELESHVDRE